MTLWMLLAGMLLLLGCGGPSAATGPVRILCPDEVTAAEAIEAGREVLTRVHFVIEKLDVEQGIIRTRPLRAAQFFELWRSDNASLYRLKEANLHSVRRSVEIRVRAEVGDRRLEAGDSDNLPPAASGSLCLECDVSVQRLSLSGPPAAGLSETEAIHAQSAALPPRVELSPGQRRAMTWIDLGEDRELAGRILERIERRLGRPN